MPTPRTAKPDASRASASGRSSGLPRQVSPGPGQPGKAVLILRQLHLQRPLTGMGVLGKDIQDDRRPVQYMDRFPKRLLQLAEMPRGEFLIENNDIRPGFLRPPLEFLHLPGPDQGGVIRSEDSLEILSNDIHSGRSA